MGKNLRTLLYGGGIIAIIIAIVAALLSVIRMFKALIIWGLIILIAVWITGYIIRQVKKRAEEED